MLLTELPAAGLEPLSRSVRSRWRTTAESIVQQVYSANFSAFECQAVDVRDLLRQVLLQIPRLTAAQRADHGAVRFEVERVGKRILEDRAEARRNGVWPNAQPIQVDRVDLLSVQSPATAVLLRCFHYLRSPRDVVWTFGVFPRDGTMNAIPHALFTISEFDLPHIAEVLPNGVSPHEVMVLSRVYVSPFAPRNLISRAMSLLPARMATCAPAVRLLVSYINPNLGFSGASLRAANWQLLCLEHRNHYLYQNGDYLTEREAIRRFGTCEFQSLRSIVPNIDRSHVAGLQPLHLFAYPLCAADRKQLRFSSNPALTMPRWEFGHAGVSDQCVSSSDSR